MTTTEQTPTVADLLRWMEDHPHADVRMRGRTGYLTTQTTSRSGGSTTVRLRDTSRRGNRQYLWVFDWDIERGTLEIKVGARYQPARDVIA